jgi:formylglycine-generating enzyme required for sulfatase activity
MLRWVIATGAALLLGACASSMSGPAAAPRAGATFSDCAACPKMVVVPPGTFQMGSDHIEPMRGNEMRPEGPIRTVTIAKAFAAGKFEVTNKEFGAFVKATGYVPAQACQVWGGIEVKQGKTWKDPDYGRPPQDNEPVVCITWRDAKAYVGWLAKITGKPYRLLSEAEWEYADHGGTSTTWPWGEDAGRICEFGNSFDITGRKDPRMTNDGGPAVDPKDLCDDRFAIVAPVGSFKPNGFGLYDMVGNVWEWVEDCSLNLHPASPVDGSPVEVQGACEKRGNKGGSWRTRLSRQRPAFRGRDPETTASNIFGFRVGRNL